MEAMTPTSATKHSAYRESFKITFDLAGAYARWLLSTLLILNSGAIAGFFQKDQAATHVVEICFFAVGVFCALVSGIFGWFNLQVAATYFELCGEFIISEQPAPPKPKALCVTTMIAVLFAFASIVCLGMGGGLTLWSIH